MQLIFRSDPQTLNGAGCRIKLVIRVDGGTISNIVKDQSMEYTDFSVQKSIGVGGFKWNLMQNEYDKHNIRLSSYKIRREQVYTVTSNVQW